MGHARGKGRRSGTPTREPPQLHLAVPCCNGLFGLPIGARPFLSAASLENS